jgi:hypothetical protein
VSMAVNVAYGVCADGIREVLGIDVDRVKTSRSGARCCKALSPAARVVSSSSPAMRIRD